MADKNTMGEDVRFTGDLRISDVMWNKTVETNPTCFEALVAPLIFNSDIELNFPASQRKSQLTVW